MEKHDDGCPQQGRGSEARRSLPLADNTVVQGMLESEEMPVVADMMGTVRTISFGISYPRLTMLVKRNGEQHGQVNQQQQPGTSEPLVAENPLHHGGKGTLFPRQLHRLASSFIILYGLPLFDCYAPCETSSAKSRTGRKLKGTPQMVQGAGRSCIREIISVRHTVKTKEEYVLNLFNNRPANASAESFHFAIFAQRRSRQLTARRPSVRRASTCSSPRATRPRTPE